MGGRVVRVLVVAVCATLAIAGAGCRAVAKKAVEEATGVKVEQDGSSVVIETDQGKATIESGKKLPEGFPGAFPVYEGEIASTGSFSQGESQSYNVVVSTDDAIDQVKAFYLKELPAKGWDIGATMDVGTGADRGVTITAEDAAFAATVAITAGSDGGTDVSIMIGTKQ